MIVDALLTPLLQAAALVAVGRFAWWACADLLLDRLGPPPAPADWPGEAPQGGAPPQS